MNIITQILFAALLTASFSVQADIFSEHENKIEIAQPAQGNVAVLTTGIINMPLDDVMNKLMKSKGYVTIHLSSDDAGCPYCVESNPIFEMLAQHHAGQMPFWRTGTEPYSQVFTSAIVRAYNIKSVPATMMFKDGVLLRQVIGRYLLGDVDSWLFTMPPTPKTDVANKTIPIVPIPPKDSAAIGVETIDQNLLEERVKKFEGLVAVNYSSYDARCLFCVEANQNFDALAKQYEGKVTFWRSMSYPHWGEAFKLPFAQKYQMRGVPMLLLFKNGVLLKKIQGFSTTDSLERNLFFTFAKPN